ncbi:MAG: acetolactate decarboxylase [Acidaminococcaceae bacterium]
MNIIGKRIFAALVVVTVAGGVFSFSVEAAKQADRETMYQVSLLKGLVAGDYYGSMTVTEFLKHGNIGMGTFDRLNGEMIVLDGVCYQALADGRVIKANSKETVPFAAVTFMDKDILKNYNDVKVTNFVEIKKDLDAEVAQAGPNSFYVCRIDGDFQKVKVRVPLAQNEPYKSLDIVMKTDQRIFEYENIKGTMVALYCPDYMSELNAAGWHFHFISNDKKMGGHVLDFEMTHGNVVMDKTDGFAMGLPNGSFFKNVKITQIANDAVNAVEKGNGSK